MSDSKDIVARLREYTQHNRPVLSSDLKTAADEIMRLRQLLAAGEEAVRSLLKVQYDNEAFAQSVMAAAGFPDEIKHHTADDLRNIVDGIGDLRDSKSTHQNLLRNLLYGVCDAIGVSAPPINADTIDELVQKVKSLRAEGMRLEAHTKAMSTGHRPGTIIPPTTERFDDIERRMAELESNVRTTGRRLDAARDAMLERATFPNEHLSHAGLAHVLGVALAEEGNGNG